MLLVDVVFVCHDVVQHLLLLGLLVAALAFHGLALNVKHQRKPKNLDQGDRSFSSSTFSNSIRLRVISRLESRAPHSARLLRTRATRSIPTPRPSLSRENSSGLWGWSSTRYRLNPGVLAFEML